MNVKLQLLSVGAVFFLGTALHAQKAKRDTGSVKDIDEVVVVAYGKQKKSAVVGSNLQINSEKLAERTLTNVSQAIDGAGPGIQVSASTGQPGASLSVRIRGISSYNNSNSPLYVVDGAVYTGSISAINTNDIESLNILKDAAATSLYGSSAANGVVLITTKKGKKGKDRVDFNVTTGVSSRATPLPDRVNAAQYYVLAWESLRNGYATNNPAATGAAANLYASNNLYTVLKNNIYNVPNNQIVIDGQINPAAKQLYNDMDWISPLFGVGLRNDYNLSLSGGTDKTTYRGSIGYLKDNGYLKTSDLERFTLRLNVDSKVKSWLKIGMNLNGTVTTTNFAVDGAANSSAYINPYRWAVNMAPIYSPYMHDAAGNTIIDPLTGLPKYDAGSNRGTDAAAGRNIVAETLWNKDVTRANTINAVAYADVNFDQYTKFTSLASYGLQDTYEKVYTNRLIGDAAGTGSTSKTAYWYRTFTWTNKLAYMRKFGDHAIDGFVAHENVRWARDYMYAYMTGQIVDNNYEFSNFINNKGISGQLDTWTKESWFGSLNYGYNDKYHLQGSIRWDASSRFATDVRWHAFWSVGANWVISNEEFLKGNSVINYLKLMGSYGEVGNDNVGYYAYQNLFSLGYNNGSQGGILYSQLADQKVTWESNNQKDVSLEFGLFNNRVTGSAGYYSRLTKNMLFNVPLVTDAGIPGDKVTRNLGDMQNSGWEFSLAGDVVKTQDFKWSLNVNASTFKNVMKRMAPGQNEIINGTKRIMAGRSIYDFWLRQWAGVDPADGSPLYIADAQYANTTAADIRTVNGTVMTTSYTKAKYDWSGTANPDLYGSFGSTFKYKGWDLNVMFTYQLGGKIYDSNYAALMGGYPQGTALSTDILNRWTTPGQVTDVPALNTATYTNASAASSRWLVSASYIQLRSAQLGYTFDKEITRGIGLDNLRVFLTGENLWAKTARKGLEPTGGSFNGTTSPRYTPARAVSIGANVSF